MENFINNVLGRKKKSGTEPAPKPEPSQHTAEAIRPVHNGRKGARGFISVAFAELKYNAGKYVASPATTDILITKYGKTVAILTAPYPDRIESARSQFGHGRMIKNL